MHISQEYSLKLYDEIDCSDISDGEYEREKIVIYEIRTKCKKL